MCVSVWGGKRKGGGGNFFLVAFVTGSNTLHLPDVKTPFPVACLSIFVYFSS